MMLQARCLTASCPVAGRARLAPRPVAVRRPRVAVRAWDQEEEVVEERKEVMEWPNPNYVGAVIRAVRSGLRDGAAGSARPLPCRAGVRGWR
jgi:hypothetical protein